MTNTTITRAQAVIDELVSAGITNATGVPCSLLSGLFLELEADDSPLRFHVAPREDTALGLASGLTLGGQPTVVLMQNSGLGYSLNVLTSFNLIYDLHLPLIVSWRGYDANDAIEHEVIGRTLPKLLDLFDIPHILFDADAPAESVRDWLNHYDSGARTAALIVTKGLSNA